MKIACKPRSFVKCDRDSHGKRRELRAFSLRSTTATLVGRACSCARISREVERKGFQAAYKIQTFFGLVFILTMSMAMMIMAMVMVTCVNECHCYVHRNAHKSHDEDK